MITVALGEKMCFVGHQAENVLEVFWAKNVEGVNRVENVASGLTGRKIVLDDLQCRK